MKLKILLTVIILAGFIYPQASWKSITSPTENSMTSVMFLDSLTGWIAGDSSFIYKTTDGGSTWQQQHSNVNYNIKDLFFLDYNYGWAVAVPEDNIANPNALIISTTDGGMNFIEEIFPTPDIYFQSVFYFNSSEGFIGGHQGNIHYTTNSGERWHKASIDSGLYSGVDIHKIKFYNNSFGLASGGHFDIIGQTWVTRNGGLNWQSYPAAPDIVTDFHFFDSLHIMGVTKEIESYGSGVTRSLDGGQNWKYSNFPYFGPATSLSFRTKNEVWVSLSTSGTVLRSVDSGYTWDSLNFPGYASILEIQFTDSLHGFGAGEFGALIKYSLDSATSAGNDKFINKIFRLDQNYPNPFNPSTVISYQVPERTFVKLAVYDILGNEVKLLVNEERDAGENKAVFNAGLLTSGVYIYRISAGAFSSAGKMVLLR